MVKIDYYLVILNRKTLKVNVNFLLMHILEKKSMRHAARGFTLLELMLTLAILGLIFGISTVGLDAVTPSSQLNAEARQLASTLALAYNRAAVLGTSVAIRYDLDHNSYGMVIPSPRDPKQKQPGKMWKLGSGVVYEDITVADYKTQKQGWIEIKISPLGYVPAHAVHLAHPKGGKVTLEVNPVTGMVKIWDGYQPFRFLVDEK